MSEQNRKHRLAIVLAGGDGTRLTPLTRAITRDDRTKQFCPVFGDRTLLEQTQRRVALRLNSTQLFTVVGWTDPGESRRVVSALRSKQFYRRIAAPSVLTAT